MKTTQKRKIILIPILIAACLLIGFFLYVSDYYHADNPIELADYAVFGEPQALGHALIFYPGGKVEAAAYVPLLEQLAEAGLPSILVEMPFNLAIFDVDAAAKIRQDFPQVQKWYVGGHSLGGAAAAMHAEKYKNEYKGLLLLAAYPTGNIEIPILAIYGSEDLILDRSKLTGIANTICLEGGNHAQFGNYGEQEGDGIAAISRDQQQKQTVTAIINFIK